MANEQCNHMNWIFRHPTNNRTRRAHNKSTCLRCNELMADIRVYISCFYRFCIWWLSAQNKNILHMCHWMCVCNYAIGEDADCKNETASCLCVWLHLRHTTPHIMSQNTYTHARALIYKFFGIFWCGLLRQKLAKRETHRVLVYNFHLFNS